MNKWNGISKNGRVSRSTDLSLQRNTEKKKIKQKLSIKGSQLAEQSIKKKQTQNQKEHFAVFLLILSLTSSPAQQWSYRQQTARVRPWLLVLKGAEQILFFFTSTVKNLCWFVLTCLGATWRMNARHLPLFCLVRTHSESKNRTMFKK